MKLLKSRSLWVCAGILLLVETTVRLIMPDGSVPAGGYHNAEIRQQIEHFRNTDDVNLLLVGSSITAVNFPALVLEEQLQDKGLSHITVFNAGIRGCNYGCIKTGIETFYTNNHQPQTLVLIVNPVDVNEGNPTVVGRSIKFKDSFAVPEFKRKLLTLISDTSHAVGFSSEIKQFIRKRKWPGNPSTIDERGYVDMGSKVIRRYDDPITISLDGPLSQALIALATNATANGSRVIVVPTYGDSIAREKFSEKSRKDFAALLETLDAIDKVELVELKPDYIPDSNYIDNIHLNTAGAVNSATALSEALYPALR